LIEVQLIDERSRLMSAARCAAVWCAALACLWVAGCKALPRMSSPVDGALHDFSVDDGDAPDDLTAPQIDLAVDERDLAVDPCPLQPVEICGNGCDDDRNGYIDDYDPACTPQVVATDETGHSTVSQLILVPSLPRFLLTPNTYAANAHATYNARFAPMQLFVALDQATEELDTVKLGSSDAPFRNYTAYPARDVCVFNNELVVVDNLHNRLHRLNADTTAPELGFAQLPAGQFLNACATDGNLLYIAYHDSTALGASQFQIFDKSYTPVGSPILMPQALLDKHYDRCLDFAWTHFGFYGLFASTNNMTRGDVLLSATQVTPFALDGAVGAPFDAGIIHGLGEFNP
jgi:hypothetical protein